MSDIYYKNKYLKYKKKYINFFKLLNGGSTYNNIDLHRFINKNNVLLFITDELKCDKKKIRNFLVSLLNISKNILKNMITQLGTIGTKYALEYQQKYNQSKNIINNDIIYLIYKYALSINELTENDLNDISKQISDIYNYLYPLVEPISEEELYMLQNRDIDSQSERSNNKLVPLHSDTLMSSSKSSSTTHSNSSSIPSSNSSSPKNASETEKRILFNIGTYQVGKEMIDTILYDEYSTCISKINIFCKNNSVCKKWYTNVRDEYNKIKQDGRDITYFYYYPKEKTFTKPNKFIPIQQ